MPELQAQALPEVAGRHPRGVEGLHEGERLLHVGQGEGPHVGDLLEARPQHPVFVEVVDDGLADLDAAASSEVAMWSCQSRWS